MMIGESRREHRPGSVRLLVAAFTVALATFAALGSGSPAAADQVVGAPASPSGVPGGSPDAALASAESHLADVLAKIAPAQAQVDALQSALNRQSARLTAAADAASARLAGVRSLLDSGWEGGSLGAGRLVALIGQSRQALDRASTTLDRVRRAAARSDLLGTFFAESEVLAALQADRDSTEARIDTLLAGSRVVDTGIQAPPGTTHISYGEWAGALLSTLGVTPCGNDMAALVAWEVAESTDAAWNPLASTHRVEGDAPFNSAGVRNYPSLGSGLQATAATLWGGYYRYGYGWIIYDLYVCADPGVTAQAINASAWCHGCADGSYVTGVLSRVEANYEAYAGL